MTHDASSWISLFEEDEVSFILATVLRCGEHLHKNHETELEDKLNKRLRLLICRDPLFRDSGLVLDREVEIFDDTSEDPIGILDFRFLGCGERRHADWYFAIEAKRLHVSFPSKWKSLVPEYVTHHQGMMCFITGRYCRGQQCGAMLGYVFDGRVENARAAVAESIRTNSLKLTRSGSCELRPSTVLGEEGRVSESSHVLEGGPFTLYHLFVGVPTGRGKRADDCAPADSSGAGTPQLRPR